MKWYLYLALKQLFPSGRFVSLFFCVSNVGVMLGVAVLLIVQSIMNGFGKEIRDKLADTDGHVRITGAGIIYQDWPLIEMAEEIEGAEAVGAYAEGMVMAMHRNIPAFPFIRGIDVMEDTQVIPLDRYLRGGTMDDLYDETCFLSAGLAQSLGAYPGAKIEIFSPILLEKLKQDEVLLPRELTVAGIFETGYGKIDENTMLVTLRLMQELYGLGNGVHGVTIRLADMQDAEAVATLLNEQLEPPFHAKTWIEQNQSVLFILQLEKTMMSFIMLFILLIASFSIAVSLFNAVVRKTREIGLLGAIGGSPRHIASIFCFQGFIIGVTGSLLGVALTVVGLHYRSYIMKLISWLSGNPDILSQFYGFGVFPVHYVSSDFIITIGFAVIGSTLAGALPAWRAARLNPADALRNE